MYFTRTARTGQATFAATIALAALTACASTRTLDSSGSTASDTLTLTEHAAAQVLASPGVVTSFQEQSATMGTARFRLMATATPKPDEKMSLLVLVHGANANEDQWDDVAIDTALFQLARRHPFSPTLLVLPNGDSANARASSESDFASFLIDELLPQIQRRFALSPDRTQRSIGGISRGGGWALKIAATRPELFGTVGAHSAVVPAGPTAKAMADIFAASRTRVWLDVGDKDGFRRAVTDFAAVLRTAGANVTFSLGSGDHSRPYWSAHADTYARFYANVA